MWFWFSLTLAVFFATTIIVDGVNAGFNRAWTRSHTAADLYTINIDDFMNEEQWRIRNTVLHFFEDKCSPPTCHIRTKKPIERLSLEGVQGFRSPIFSAMDEMIRRAFDEHARVMILFTNLCADTMEYLLAEPKLAFLWQNAQPKVFINKMDLGMTRKYKLFRTVFTNVFPAAINDITFASIIPAKKGKEQRENYNLMLTFTRIYPYRSKTLPKLENKVFIPGEHVLPRSFEGSFNGQQLVVGFRDHNHHTTSEFLPNGTRVRTGIYVEMSNYLAQKHNFTYTPVDTASYGAMLEKVNTSYVDLFTSGMYMAYPRYEVVSISPAVTMINAVIMVISKPKSTFQWEQMWEDLQPSMYWVIIFLVICMIIVEKIIDRMDKDWVSHEPFIMTLIRMITVATSPTKNFPRHGVGMFFFALVMLFALFSRMIYEAMLKGHVFVYRPPKLVNTFEEFIDEKLHWLAPSTDDWSLEFFFLDGVQGRRMRETIRFLPTENKTEIGAIDYMEKHRNQYGVVVSDRFAYESDLFEFMDKNFQHPFHVMKEPVNIRLNNLVFPRGFPNDNIEHFTRTIVTAVEMGLVDRWTRITEAEFRIKNYDRMRARGSIYTPDSFSEKPMTMDVLDVAFYYMLIGYLVAFVVFVAEIVYHKVQVLRLGSAEFDINNSGSRLHGANKAQNIFHLPEILRRRIFRPEDAREESSRRTISPREDSRQGTLQRDISGPGNSDLGRRQETLRREAPQQKREAPRQREPHGPNYVEETP